MPEGPQVHLVAERHQALFAKQKLHVESPDDRSADVVAVFDEQKLQRVDAVGKHLLYIFGRDRILHVHLGRFGKFRVGELPLPKVDGILRFRFSTQSHWAELRGAVAIEPFDAAARKLLEARIGPDPLNGDSPARGFAQILARRAPIGGLLMDQSILAGIGNIFRAEMLFRAGVSPKRPGKLCEPSLLERLWNDVHELMQYSMTHDGRIVTTERADRQYPKRAKVARGDAFYVYHRTGRPCRHCGTPIEQMPMAGRTVFFCPTCQPE